ncbi:MATE family efflux transporter [Ilyobacter polytropus]|uniref:MATE efflux family protein n=1 Tax=Ilyobacter polytropus (strain ATCC 51220 / DSM 2926 / LMG 16218 / CuHBu1) TaxID=572544 RepID=E3HAY2_ILYPC|nr:MATE family efflux transporter [Ilyobacter polytropus]ADO82131.1 MATE efflux family protein [Ilyobacter polytropus DSM 2926]
MDLTKGDIGQAVKKVAIPSSVGFLFNTLFNVVDSMYTGYIGPDALAGLAMSFPVFFILISLGSGIGTGVTAILSNFIGEKSCEKARVTGRDALTLGVIFAFFITFVGIGVDGPLFKYMGGAETSVFYGEKYTTWIFIGSVFFVMNMVFNGILSSQGDTKSYRNFLIIGFFVNIVLDPFFIFILKMSTDGVAIATVIVQIMGNFYLYKKVKMSQLFSGHGYKLCKPHMENYKNILSQGIPASLNMMTIALGIFVINYFVIKNGGDMAVAAYGISMRIEQMALLPAIGLNIAALSIAGQSYGAGETERVMHVYKKTLKYGIVIMTIAMFIILPLSGYLLRIFTRNSEIIRYGMGYFRVEILVFNSYILLNISVSVLQGLKRPKFAIIIGIYRQFLMPILLFPVFTNITGDVTGIWWGIFTINWSAALVAVLYVNRVYKKILVLKEKKSRITKM